MIRLLTAFTFLLVLLSSNVGAQSISDSIFINDAFNGYEFIFKGQPITANEVSALMESNYEAYDAFESGREAKVFGYVFCSIGTGLIVYPFITSILGKDTNWALTFAGMGFAGLSIPIFSNYHKKTEQALELYNGSLIPPNSGYQYNNSLNFRFSGLTVGLAYQF
jgi:hypothetical protein